MSDTSDKGDLDPTAQLDELKARHQALHDEIDSLEALGALGGDQLILQRLKREKLQLKDQITNIEDNILPDIIA